ncbi:MAG: DUF2288 domain-containing protein [Nitrosomonadales bacterium]|nr:DUF2288 domain-containing protein [Nitrosomonadales bacterium]
MTAADPQEIYRAKVNLETSRIAWKELQRFFASGAAIFVNDELDLVEVAFQFSQDNKAQVERWLLTKKVGKVSDDQATKWIASDADMWAVVVSPWVLVQPAE